MKKSKSRSHPLTRAQRKARARVLDRDLHKLKVYDPKDYDGHDLEEEAWR